MRITELYKLVEGATQYYLTSADDDIVYEGNTYVATPIERSEAETRNELTRSNLEVTLSIDHTISQKYMQTIVDTIVSLTVFTLEDSVAEVTWKGRLASIKPEGAKMKLIFESIFTSLRRPGLRERFQRNCRFALYGRGCFVDKATFEKLSTATAVSGATVTCPGAAAYADDYFTGGMIKAPDDTYRFIIKHTGNQITLMREIESLTTAVAGGVQNVKLYPGCDRTRETCKNKFNNLLNNGSFAFIPLRNPFNGSSFM